jgi:hypothetical protein
MTRTAADCMAEALGAINDLRRFAASNHHLLRFDYSAGVVLLRSADRRGRSPLKAASLLQEAY